MKPEALLSCAVREAVELYRLRERCICFHIHNDLNPSFKSKLPRPAFIKKLKDQGCVIGVADWIFIWPSRIAFAFEAGFIELKIDTAQSPGQQTFEQWCQRVGPYYRIARSVDEVIGIWKEWRLV